MSNGQMDIIGIGAALVDIFADITDEDLSRLNMPKGAMTLIDIKASKDLLGQINVHTSTAGGSAANTIASSTASSLLHPTSSRDRRGADFLAQANLLSKCGNQWSAGPAESIGVPEARPNPFHPDPLPPAKWADGSARVFHLAH